MRLSLIGTGGTIASRQTEAGVVAQFRAAELLASIEDHLPAGTDVIPTDVGVRPSFALRLDDMRTIALAAVSAARDHDGVVVLHGTDSMEETSFLTDLLHDGPTPIVFTGAQRANDVPDSDARANMAWAVSTASSPAATSRGVLVAFNETVWAARGVRKVHTADLAGFADPDNVAVCLDDSGDRVRSTFPDALEVLARSPLPRVDVIAAVPGGDGSALRATAASGARAVVLQALGIGNAGPEDTAAVKGLTDQGTPVLITSRVQGGAVHPIYGGGGGADLHRHGAIFAGALSPWQARVLAAVALVVAPADPTTAMKQWLRSVSG